MESILVTIIIPTYQDWDRLSLCLNALSVQSFSQELFEVIVVNNDPDDTIPSDLKLSSNCQIITEIKPGSYSARNAALKISKGKIIGFTDSDCVPDKDWIKNADEYFKTHEACSRIAGKITIFFQTAKPTLAEQYDKLYAFNQKGYVKSSGTGVTANMFTYKYVFDKVGYFNDDLMSGGDFSWGTTAHANGFTIQYVRNVIVYHPGRQTLRELIKKEKRIGGSQAFFLKNNKSVLLNFFYFIKALGPRFATMRFLYRKEHNLSFSGKVQMYLFRQYLLSIRAYEKFRVQQGKKATRS